MYKQSEVSRMMKRHLRRNSWVYPSSDRDVDIALEYFERANNWDESTVRPQLGILFSDVITNSDPFNKVPLDGLILPLVVALRVNGYPTVMSCCGHSEGDFIRPAQSDKPYVLIEFRNQLDWKTKIDNLNNLLKEFYVGRRLDDPYKLKTKTVEFLDGGMCWVNFEGHKNFESGSLSKLLLRYQQLETIKFASFLFRKHMF